MIMGSIPACTGKPQTSVSVIEMAEVYPRMYGETASASAFRPESMGLSPHVRGNHLVLRQSQGRQRSIPACTGKPETPSVRRRRTRVYPRMYGETIGPISCSIVWTGLSPHVRGNRARCRGGAPVAGSIPACTGKPPEYGGSRNTPTVYPRMYGETGSSATAGTTATGLSPHVRGNHRLRRCINFYERSIPACTGKPTACRDDRKAV